MRDELRSGLVLRARSAAARRADRARRSRRRSSAFPLLTFLPLFAQNVFHEGVGTYSRPDGVFRRRRGRRRARRGVAGQIPHMGLTALLVQAVYGMPDRRVRAVARAVAERDPAFLTGAALMIVLSLVTSLVQLIAPNEMRGRVMSIYMVAFRGGMPLGSLVSG